MLAGEVWLTGGKDLQLNTYTTLKREYTNYDLSVLPPHDGAAFPSNRISEGAKLTVGIDYNSTCHL